MGLQPGDGLTLTLNAPIQVSRFVILKPFASVHRELGDDPEADIVSMRAELRRLYVEQLAQEIEVMDSALEAIGDNGTLEDLKEWCLKELGDVDARTTAKVSRRGDQEVEEEEAEEEDGEEDRPRRTGRRSGRRSSKRKRKRQSA
jgi:hypothetical protein